MNSNIKSVIYDKLVNSHFGIKKKYLKYHEGSCGAKKYASYLYLMLLQIEYHVFRRKSFREISANSYEEKDIYEETSESVNKLYNVGTVNEFLNRLYTYDVISFDVFDTLLFRPFSEPTDVFSLLGDNFGIPNFKELRIKQEEIARNIHKKRTGNNEVSLSEIWSAIEKNVGISSEEGMKLEICLEKELCYANPFMLKVINGLRKSRKRIIAVSDMYLSGGYIKHLLENCGYEGIEKVYVSCEYGAGKSDGKLFDFVTKELGKEEKVIHIGDNKHSDVLMAKKAGWDSLYYPNTDSEGEKRRPYDMSSIIGGAYRGIVNHYLLSGDREKSEEYEYGYIYGGLFVLGYCNFIHDYCCKNEIEKIMFLARDGNILKQIYDQLFPNDNTVYVYWSRLAGVKVMAAYNKYDYYRRFIDLKIGERNGIEAILKKMELEELIPEIGCLLKGDELTPKNAEILKEFLDERFDRIQEIYSSQTEATRVYFKGELEGFRRAAAVDIGWAGSGALSIAHMVEKVWDIPCEITGIVAGTNTIFSTEPDASEFFLQTGKMVSYMYSQSHNRDLLKKHDPGKGYNMFWELLLSSPEPSFVGYYIKDGQVCPRFGEPDENVEGILEIQQGIKDFVEDYMRHFGNRPYMMNISGRDAYAPMMVAASNKEKYLKNMLKRFDINADIN